MAFLPGVRNGEVRVLGRAVVVLATGSAGAAFLVGFAQVFYRRKVGGQGGGGGGSDGWLLDFQEQGGPLGA